MKVCSNKFSEAELIIKNNETVILRSQYLNRKDPIKFAVNNISKRNSELSAPSLYPRHVIL